MSDQPELPKRVPGASVPASTGDINQESPRHDVQPAATTAQPSGDLDAQLNASLRAYLAQRAGSTSTDPGNAAYLGLITLITNRPAGFEDELRQLAAQLDTPGSVQRHRAAARFALALASGMEPTQLYQHLITEVYPAAVATTLNASDAILMVEVGLEMARALHRSDLANATALARDALELIRHDLNKVAMEPTARDFFESKLLATAVKFAETPPSDTRA